jgi:small-conductance mechanosensitive channel
MPRPTFRLFPLCSPLLFIGAALAAEPPASGAISPDAAQRAIALLEDEGRRAEVILALKAVSEAAPAADRSNPAPAPALPAQAAPPAPDPAIAPLEADGLIARTLQYIGGWVDGLGQQVVQLKQAASDLPAWSRASFDSAAGRRLLVEALVAMAAVFAIGLALEWTARGALRRPRRALIEYADEADARGQAEAQRERQRRERDAQMDIEAARVAQAERQDSVSAAGTQPADEGVALVQTHKNGVDQLEAVPLAKAEGSVEARSDATGPAPAVPPPASASRASAAREHWNALRRLPLALAMLVLDLLPLALFFCAAGLIMRWLTGRDENVAELCAGFVNAYVTTRIAMAIVRLLISPVGHGLRVLRVSPGVSAVLLAWARRFVVLATFGVALADAAQVLGVSEAGRLAIIKIISLFVHLFAVILIFQVRRPVGEAIAAPADASGPLAAARNWLAQVWPVFAAVFVMGAWVVWALGVQDGFSKLIHFIGVSGIVIISGRVVAILLLGALGRALNEAHCDEGDGRAGGSTGDTRGSLAQRHYPAVRGLTSFIITVCTIIALCQVWGFDAIGWFAPGTIGRSLIAAASTILVAAGVAMAIWQAANAAIDRRLARWSEQGDLVRAARLRTLLPMMRSGLLALMVMIVGLTTLNQIGVNTAPLLAGASIIGVALGFGSQKLVQDFITGIFLLMENAMQVGDVVTVAGVSGTVEYLSIRTVRLRAGDGSLHIVPFSSVSTVNNTNRGLGNAAVRISVSHDTDVEQAIAELKNIGKDLRNDPMFRGLILDDIEVWGVDSVDGSMVTLAGQIRCVDKGRWGVQREINRRILERFRELGIAIADPRLRFLVPLGEAPAPTAGQAEEASRAGRAV